LAIALLGASTPAMADSPVGTPIVVGEDHPIVITTPGDRSTDNIEFVVGLTGVGLVLTGLGVFYNFDSRSASNAVNAVMPTGQPWTTGDQIDYDDAHRYAHDAAIFYSLGGAVLIGALVTWIATAPDDHTVVIRPHAAPTIAPTPGGAVLGGSWRF